MAKIVVINENISINETIKNTLEQKEHIVTVHQLSENSSALEIFKNSPGEFIFINLNTLLKERYDLIGEILLEYPNVKTIAIHDEEENGPIELKEIKEQLGIWDIISTPISKKHIIKSVCDGQSKKTKGASVIIEE